MAGCYGGAWRLSFLAGELGLLPLWEVCAVSGGGESWGGLVESLLAVVGVESAGVVIIGAGESPVPGCRLSGAGGLSVFC